MTPLSASLSVFLKKDKLCSGLAEITLLVLNNRLEALAGLLGNSLVNTDGILRTVLINMKALSAEGSSLLQESTRHNVL